MADESFSGREVGDLKALRSVSGLSQSNIADNMGITQPSVHKIENQEDIHLSTLSRYIEGLGGVMKLIVSIPGAGDFIYSPSISSRRVDGRYDYSDACKLVAGSGNAKISNIQRELGVGYNKAKQWIDQMESDGLVGTPNRSGRREVYYEKS